MSKQENMETNGKYDDELLKQIELCQTEIDDMNLKSTEEILEIEDKFNKLRQPFYEKRAEIIKRISNFWVTAIINHPKISRILDEEDEECLHSLKVLEVEEFEDVKSGYRMHFYFDENPYFENTVLSKEFHLECLSKSTSIKWKEGKNILEHLRAGSYRNKKRNSEYKSFFDWFVDDTDIVEDKIAMAIRDELWQNPLQYYLVPDLEVDPEDDGEEEGN